MISRPAFGIQVLLPPSSHSSHNHSCPSLRPALHISGFGPTGRHIALGRKVLHLGVMVEDGKTWENMLKLHLTKGDDNRDDRFLVGILLFDLEHNPIW